MTIKNVTWARGDGTVIPKLRLFADEDKAVTNNGVDTYFCIDVDSAEGWYEIDAPDPEKEANAQDYQEALEVFGA